jgi:hypothetical protein
MSPIRRRDFLAGSAVGVAHLAASGQLAGANPAASDHNVVVITLDGLRWQEVFRGAEEGLLSRTGGDKASAAQLRDEFWRPDAKARRETLLPFFWGTIARDGWLFGDADSGHVAELTNGLRFSYPGYNEMFTGAPDPRLDSNNKVPNPNINVFEWLHGRPDFAGKVACFCTWDVFPFILNRERAGLPVQAGWEPIADADPTPEQRTINGFFSSLHREWENNPYDALSLESALAHISRHRPRVVYIALGETDEHSHHDRYDFYLRSAHRADAQIARLWQLLQSLDTHRGKTYLLLTTDHGRGDGPLYTSHGKDIAGAERVWFAALGPDVRPPASAGRCTQSQIAATIAALVGEDFRSAGSRAAAPLPCVAS